MNQQTARKHARLAFAVATTIAAAGVAAPKVWAFDQETKPGQPDISIKVQGFQDLGGAEYKGPDGKPLTERLVSALRLAIADAAKHSYHVADPTDATVVTKNATAFVVESEVTGIEIGDPVNHPYMLVTRLYREGKPRKLVAQFAGNARTLRDLTGNLSNESSASKLGLIGGVAQEIVEAAENARPLLDAFDDMVKTTTATHRVTVDVMSDANGKQEPRQSVVGGQRYRLRVNSQDPGAVYIVSIDPTTKRPSTPYAQNEPLDVATGSPVILPPNDPFIAPKSASALEYVVFVRKRGTKSADVFAERPASAQASLWQGQSVQVASLRERGLLPHDLLVGGVAGLDQAESSAIELLSSPTLKGPGSLDPGVSELLTRFQGDPDGSWIATRVKVAVTKGEDTGSAAPGTNAR